MKRIILGLVGAASLLSASLAHATPITANSGANFYTDMVIATGGPLPIGLDSQTAPPSFALAAESGLDAPDAAEFADLTTHIAGDAPDNPSIFGRTSSSTRNAGTEGAFSSNNTQLYQIIELETEWDGDNDVSERGIGGAGLAQANIETELYDTGAASDVSFERVFTFTNDNPFAMTFGIQGVFEMDLFAIADGESSFAESTATIDMFFRSSGILDIVFADTAPNVDVQTEEGDNAMMSFIRETDVANTGHLSLTGHASASGVEGVLQQAFGMRSFSYALGITLQPGEEITMSHITRYTNLATIGEFALEVDEPSHFLLMLPALMVMFAKRRLLSWL